MSVPDTVEVVRPGQEETKPWYSSVTFWGAALLLAGFFFKSLSVDPAIRDGLAGALAIVGTPIIAWGRATARSHLTLRRRK